MSHLTSSLIILCHQLPWRPLPMCQKLATKLQGTRVNSDMTVAIKLKRSLRSKPGAKDMKIDCLSTPKRQPKKPDQTWWCSTDLSLTIETCCFPDLKPVPQSCVYATHPSKTAPLEIDVSSDDCTDEMAVALMTRWWWYLKMGFKSDEMLAGKYGSFHVKRRG